MSATRTETAAGTSVYRINEIFYSLQGEGRWTGMPAVFIRFAGCNLRCPFCDTDFSTSVRMSLADMLREVKDLSQDCRRIVVTGGEPALQIDDAFVEAFHAGGYRIHVETNGTRPLPAGIDWVTLSPKDAWQDGAAVVLAKADEVKIVYTGQSVEKWAAFPAACHYLQPCSGQNTKEVVGYILDHPIWQLSLQTHKILDIR